MTRHKFRNHMSEFENKKKIIHTGIIANHSLHLRNKENIEKAR